MRSWALALAGVVCLGTGCESDRPGRGPDGQAPRAAPDAADAAAIAPLARAQVLLYFPSAKADGLVTERHEIFETLAPGDRAKQILSDLIAGPTGAGAMPSIPAGTRLRQVYVLADGTAFADFSNELRTDIGGGSAAELQAVYSIVNSIALNVPEVTRVGILIEGQPVETLNGHLDLTRPLPPRRDLVLGEERAQAGRGPAAPRAAAGVVQASASVASAECEDPGAADASFEGQEVGDDKVCGEGPEQASGPSPSR